MESIPKISAQWGQVTSSMEFRSGHTTKEMDWYNKKNVHEDWKPYQKIAEFAIHPGNAHGKSAHSSLRCYWAYYKGDRKSIKRELSWG